jgi:16S rRNA G966 N2-methylase RsmD
MQHKKKKFFQRVMFLIMNPNESIVKRMRLLYHNYRGLDFKPDFNYNQLGIEEARANGHEAMQNFNSLSFLLNQLKINENDSIIDLGCGKGHALVQFSKYQFKKVVGVELSRALCVIATKNLKLLKIKHAEVINEDAGKYTDYTGFNYVYLFNPFPCNVVKEVLVNLEDSLKKNPRELTIIYNHPVCSEIFDKSNCFKRINELTYKFNKDTYLKIFIYSTKSE